MCILVINFSDYKKGSSALAFSNYNIIICIWKSFYAYNHIDLKI